MLILSASLQNRPILSLRTGGVVATTTGLIINPNNLKIEGFYCQDKFDKSQKVLVSIEVRDILPQGIVVNDHESLSDASDLVRLQPVMDIGFDVINKTVVTASKTRVGKVGDYAADSSSLYIQKLYVQRSLLKSIGGGQLSIDRNSIIEITNKKIIVQEILKPLKGSVATATN